MMCSSCGRETQPGDRFCPSCGRELAPPTCPRCATASRPGDVFCGACGVELASSPATADLGSPPKTVTTKAVETAAQRDAALDDEFEFDEDSDPPRWNARLAPASGLPARDAPDPSAPVATDLAPATQLLVLEERELWARVAVESGWSGWVDARRLVDPDLAEVATAPTDGAGSR